MLDWNPATVRYVDEETAKWLGVQKLADFVDLHSDDHTTAGADDKPCHFATRTLASRSSGYVFAAIEAWFANQFSRRSAFVVGAGVVGALQVGGLRFLREKNPPGAHGALLQMQ